MKCNYHPEVDAVGACVSCGRFICSECKVVLGDKLYCNACAEKLFAEASAPPAANKPHYNTALRVISGICGVFFVMGAITGLQYFIESGLVTELIVDMISIAIAAALLAMALIPGWVSSRLNIKLERGSVFGSIFAALIIIYFIAAALGPEPPGGWLNYGEPSIDL